MIDAYDAYGTEELAAVYDAVYAAVDDAAFWQRIADEGGDPVLELACGTGRVLLPLARAGFAVTGLDISPAMIEYCRAKLQHEPRDVQARVSLLVDDMTSFELAGRFGTIVCAFNSFHHLRTTEQQVACLDRCRMHLAPGGRLVLDLFNPDPAPPLVEAAPAAEAEPPEAHVEDDSSNADVLTVEWTGGKRIRRWMSGCEYDRTAQTNDCTITYEIIETDGSTRQIAETFPMRIIYRYELEHLLARCGFRIVRLHGDYARRPFSEESIGMIAVAEVDSVGRERSCATRNAQPVPRSGALTLVETEPPVDGHRRAGDVRRVG